MNHFTNKLIVTLILIAPIIGNTTVNAADNVATTWIKNIDKIEVNGNVKLILVQDAKERVEIYDQYYEKNALVQQQGNDLHISAYDKNTLTVIAYVNNISVIEASSTASVTTFGNFNLLNLSVVLNDQASADIHVHTFNLSTTMNGASSLNLAGTAENHAAVLGSESKMKMGDFTAQETSISIADKPVLVHNHKSRYDDLNVSLLEKLF